MPLRRDNAIVMLASWLDACAMWRLYMPHLNYPGSQFFCFANRPDFNTIAMHDIAIVQRCCTKGQYDFLKTMYGMGLRVIYDLDDNVWQIPEYNPAHHVLSAARQGFTECIQLTDAVTVATRTLEKMVRKHVRHLYNRNTKREIPIFVCENRIEERMFAPPGTPQPLIGWGGSSSHAGDISLIEPGIAAILQERPDICAEFRGHPSMELIKYPNYRHGVWMPVAEYAARMPVWGWCMTLAPVLDTIHNNDHDFNSSKSCIKLVEAGYCGIPCLASWVRPYEEFCYHDPELKYLLCASATAFTRKIRELVFDEAMRVELGSRMRKVVTEHYSWSKPHDGWQKAIDYVRQL